MNTFVMVAVAVVFYSSTLIILITNARVALSLHICEQKHVDSIVNVSLKHLPSVFDIFLYSFSIYLIRNTSFIRKHAYCKVLYDEL